MPALASNSGSEPAVPVGLVPACHAGGRWFESVAPVKCRQIGDYCCLYRRTRLAEEIAAIAFPGGTKSALRAPRSRENTASKDSVPHPNLINFPCLFGRSIGTRDHKAGRGEGHMKRQRALMRLAVAAAGLLVAAGVATAASGGPDGGIAVSDGARDAHQHGITEGHLHPEGSSSNVSLVSKLRLKNVVPEKIADVGVFKGYAYLAAWGVVTCKYNGIHVVDVRNPASPKEAAFIASKEGSYPGEGIQGLHIDTPAFNGDILVSNNEKCKEPAGFGGMNIYDISKPTSPTPLVEGVGDSTVAAQGKKDAHEIHSVFAWDAGDKAYAVIVDNEEGVDVDIVDITDPKKASLIAEYDLDQKFPQILQASPSNLVEVFFHDVVVKEIGGRQVMLLSYWDAGYVKIDVTDPTKISYLGDTDFTDPDPEAAESGFIVPPEGNGHEAEFTADNAYVIGADEDFGPFALQARNVTDGTDITSSQGSDTRRLEEGQTIEGSSVFVGRACSTGDPAVPAGDPNIVDIAVV